MTGDMTLNLGKLADNVMSVICIYTNSDKNEFAIGIKEDKQFRATTKVGEVYTRFVDCYDLDIEEEDGFDWKHELKNWIIAAKKEETVFLEVDFKDWSESGERIK